MRILDLKFCIGKWFDTKTPSQIKLKTIFLRCKIITCIDKSMQHHPKKDTMKMIKSLLFLLALVCIGPNLFAQGFTSPADSNAVVYFVRVSSYGGLASFEYFHDKKFIGIFKGKNYMRYECPAGEQFLWASSEDKEFLKCNFKAGETYIVLVNIEMGAWKARIGLEPITADNEVFERAKKLILTQKPIETTEAKIKETQKKLDERGFTENIMQHYEAEWKDTKTKIITADMFIPKDKLK
jgi:hypothetical protein